GRVRFVGQVPNERLQAWYCAADVLLLASTREGWPNVLLEALACGTPVVATAVGGVPEVLQGAEGSCLSAHRSGQAFARCIEQVMSQPGVGEFSRRHASGFGWEATSQAQLNVFRSLLGQEKACA
ncbi:glycosyltransferase, partial [Ralstonia sp.]|uniref:glycosyltransferase n=1 Tax=Ralstonia sp. TaxID=54061 RepID=UPI002579449E